MNDAQTISWIFLATAIASQKESADWRGISSIADGINHAVPTHKEMQTSITWLTQNEFIVKNGRGYVLTSKGLAIYNKASENSSALLKVWNHLESTIRNYC